VSGKRKTVRASPNNRDIGTLRHGGSLLNDSSISYHEFTELLVKIKRKS